MRTRSFFRIVCILSLGLYAACNTGGPTTAQLPTVDLSRMTPISLSVGKITFVDEYQPPLRAPNVDHLIRPTPADNVHRWVNERIRATGGDAILEVTTSDASIVEVNLPRTAGMKGLFTKDQAQRYDGHISVEMRIYAPGELMSKSSVTAEVSQSRTIAENATLDQREALFNALSNDMLTQLNGELERNIGQYFASYRR